MRYFYPTIILTLFLFSAALPLKAGELSGYIETEAQIFANDAQHAGQKRDTASLAVEVEYYHDLTDALSFVATPFARIDAVDSERTHFDFREFNLLWVQDHYEIRAGLGKVFWGVTEFVHLADIINQTDGVESLDGEEKLGQPMVQLSVPTDAGTLDLFVLPGFRERTFPGKKGRLRAGWVVDTDRARYESGAEESHVDLAVRYSHSFDIIDAGIYHFRGTSREPTLVPDLDNQALIPYYQQISQTGLDLQITTGSWLLKLETIFRTGQGESFFASTGGFEYTFTGIAGTRADLGAITEIAWDERQENATTPYENDIMFGLRLAVNDMASTEVLAGIIKDLNDSSALITLEASSRIGENWKITLEASAFLDIETDDVLYDLREDDSIKFKLAYYF